ncbi:unnamed protein product [Lathyrus sativus]|nr:unnamed protein product [Lathyrus sativus]
MNYGGLADVHNEMDDDSKEEEDYVSNIVIMGVSMLLLASVTVAVFANLSGGTKNEGNFKSVKYICAKTESPGTCLHVLKRIGERASPLDYINVAINATLKELMIVNIPKPDSEGFLTPLQRESYRDCLELLSMGKDELERVYVMANSSVDSKEIINSLSAIISYQQTCSNELMITNNFDILGYSLKLPLVLTRITLAIVDNFFEKPVFEEGFKKMLTRANLQAVEVDHENKRIIVARDGRGHFTTITESLNACARNKQPSCVIYVMKGVYEERVVIPKNLEHVFMYGDGPTQTVVTGINTTIVTTPFRSASFVVKGKGFICKDMGFTAPAHIADAPALLVFCDHAAFFNCKIDGGEGSLYAVANRQFYGNCEIHGSVDIIKGDSATMIQNSRIIVKPQNSSIVPRKKVMSFQSRIDKHERTGFVIQNCTIIAEQGETNQNNHSLVGSTCLGIPCNEYSRTVVMESFLGDVIRPRGWCQWSDNYGVDTASFIEHNNRGIGAITGKRVHWESFREVSQNHKSEMMKFTADEFIQANQWLKSTAIPYEPGFFFHK